MTLTFQLEKNFPDAEPPKGFAVQLTNSEHSFLVTLQDFTDPTSNFLSLAKRPNLLIELIQQMKHSHQTPMQRELGLNNF